MEVLYFILTVYSLGFCITSLLVYCVIKNRNLRKNGHDYCCLFVLFCLLLWIILIWPIDFLIIWNGGLDGSLGKTLCQLNGWFITIAASTLMLAQMLMAIDRYTVIVRESKLSNFAIQSFLLGGFMINCGMTAIQGLLHDGGFTPLEGDLWCFFTMNYEHSVTEIWPTLIMISYFGMFSVLQNGVHALVLLKTKRVFSETSKYNQASGQSSAAGSDNGFNSSKQNREIQRAIFQRCMAVFTAFQMSYGLSFLLYLYRIIWNSKVPPLLELVSTAMGVSDTLITPLLLLYMRRDYRKAVSDLFRKSPAIK